MPATEPSEFAAANLRISVSRSGGTGTSSEPSPTVLHNLHDTRSSVPRSLLRPDVHGARGGAEGAGPQGTQPHQPLPRRQPAAPDGALARPDQCQRQAGQRLSHPQGWGSCWCIELTWQACISHRGTFLMSHKGAFLCDCHSHRNPCILWDGMQHENVRGNSPTQTCIGSAVMPVRQRLSPGAPGLLRFGGIGCRRL